MPCLDDIPGRQALVKEEAKGVVSGGQGRWRREMGIEKNGKLQSGCNT